MEWLQSIYPIWEERYSQHRPPPAGKTPRRLLRPVYWLGNWQFACLGYYHPPHRIHDRCVRAEPFPVVLTRLVKKIQSIAHRTYRGPDMPSTWHLNTCLINLYGSQLVEGRRIDCARVGEHKDYEPGPVASLSLGERAIFQFVKGRGKAAHDSVVFQQWLEDSSLQIFGGERWKQHLFHRIQRVDRRAGYIFALNVNNFQVRRINFTFRYVPDEHIRSLSVISRRSAEDVVPYVQHLASKSEFFRSELEKFLKKLQ